jgi:PTS system mannose-specific IIA component
MNNTADDTGTIGIIVTHGRLAEELLRTAELIIGTVEDCYAISGSDLCDEELVQRIRRIIVDSGREHAVIFVDYFGGSCCINSARAIDGIRGVKVVSGVNLPLLLDFLTKQGKMGFDEMIRHLVSRGSESIKVLDF